MKVFVLSPLCDGGTCRCLRYMLLNFFQIPPEVQAAQLNCGSASLSEDGETGWDIPLLVNICSQEHKSVVSFFSVCVPGADLFFEHHVTGLYRHGSSWEVQRNMGGSEIFDAVILTMPVPQILQLQGDVGHCKTYH